MNKKIASLLLTSSLLVTVVGCTDARTSSEAPDPNANANFSTSNPTASPQNTQAAVEDAQDETRKRQLESDTRAREQRNDATGGSTDRTDSDLASEVRNKLEANIPKGNLTVESKDASVIVSGTVSSANELDKIKGLAMEIKGVKAVTVKATVATQ